MNIKLNQLVHLLKRDLGLFLYISFGIFLFILFFQPFPLVRFDFNNTLIFISGIALIVFIFMVLVRFFYGFLIQGLKESNKEYALASYLGGAILLVLISISLAFYLRYVGLVGISFHIMLKIILVSLVPPVVLRLHSIFTELKEQNTFLIEEKELIQQKIEECQEEFMNKSIELNSENKTEKLDIVVSDIAFVKSADNYVEIIFRKDNILKKKLLRNTLKNIEQQLKPYSSFVRSHRICIVNRHYIEKLNKGINKYWLSIKGYDEHIPVSRQYLLQFKRNLQTDF